MRVEFVLRADLHRRGVEMLQGLEGEGWTKRQHRWSITLESKNPTHRRQFWRMYDCGQIAVNGHEPNTLALFEPGFGRKEAKRLLAELALASDGSAPVQHLPFEQVGGGSFVLPIQAGHQNKSG